MLSLSNQLQKQLEQKARRREKKKKTRMAVSGKSVLGLQRIIKKKARLLKNKQVRPIIQNPGLTNLAHRQGG